MELFSEIELKHWRQFDSINIDLSKQSTVLTGPNGCGKTTILNVLSNHFGWNLQFAPAPFVGKKKKKKIFSDLRKILESEEPTDNAENVGHIKYSSGGICQLLVPPSNPQNPQYHLQYSGQQPVVGLHIPSHRPAITFQKVDQLPTNPKNNQQHYQEFQQLLLQTYGSANVRNPGLILKQSLISLALFGYGNQAVEENSEYTQLFEGFQDILRYLLPESLQFQKLEVRMPDVVLVTKTGDFLLDSMSGGVNSLFGIAWQIHMYGADKVNCTVIIDEPENHLHPSMQRTLLPSLEKAFPKYRFLIATHSPFIVTSNPDANVFGLIYNERHRIVSEHLDEFDLASSPDKVLREILDVPSTIPVWVEKKIMDVLRKHELIEDGKDKINLIFSELKELGLSDLIGGYHPRKEEDNH